MRRLVLSLVVALQQRGYFFGATPVKRLTPETLVLVFVLLFGASQTQADIYQWAYINPSDPTQGVVQSSVVCRGGYGVSAVPNAYLNGCNLTQAYLIGANLTNAALECDLDNANLTSANLTSADLFRASFTNATFTNATVARADFSGTNLTASQLYSTTDYKTQNLQGIRLMSNDLSGWSFAGQDLTGAHLDSATLTNTDFTNATIAGAGFNYSKSLTASQLYSTASY
jgi:hypothetical protein